MKTLFYQYLQHLVSAPLQTRFLLAVSGGIDSCVMAHLFDTYNLTFDIAHCNFHLRGEDSNKDMQFVEDWILNKNRKVWVKEFDTLAIREKSGKSIEMVARELRYVWFAEIGKDYDFICTAHHANDNAETLLLNLIRGAGYRGLNGIPEKNGKIIRPLLPFTSAQIKQYAREYQIPYREDKTNQMLIYQRNKIRNQLIPVLEELNPQLIDTFARNISLFNAQYSFYNEQIELQKKHLLQKKDEIFIIEINSLKKIKHVKVVLYEILTDFGFNYTTVELIIKHLNSISGKQFFSATHCLLKDRNRLIIKEKTIDSFDEIVITQIEEIEQYGFKIEEIEKTEPVHFYSDNNILYVDKSKLLFPLKLRHWKEGDCFYSYGMTGKKKLSNFFIDNKIDIYQKNKIWLLCSQDNIVWIVGYRSDRRFAIQSSTKTFLKIIYYGKF